MGLLDAILKTVAIKAAENTVETVGFTAVAGILAVKDARDAKKQGLYTYAPKTANRYRGKDKEYVFRDLSANGFTNVSFMEIRDLINGKRKKYGSVERILVKGRFLEPGKKYRQDVNVVVYYHAFKNPSKDPRE